MSDPRPSRHRLRLRQESAPTLTRGARRAETTAMRPRQSRSSVAVLILLIGSIGFAGLLSAEVIGSFSTKFKWLGPNDQIVIEVFEDDDIPGVACYLSRAKTGGVSGAVGIAEDTSDSAIHCVQIGPIELAEEIRNGKRNGDEVFKKRTSVLFKTLQVVRLYDAPRHTLVYMSYSDRVIEGSPKNSITAVPIRPWPDGEDSTSSANR